MSAPKKMIGLPFDRWIVLSFAGYRQHAHSQATRMYHCRCECGVERDVPGASLREGRSRSCGCLNRELKARAKAKASSGTWGVCELAVALGYPVREK